MTYEEQVENIEPGDTLIWDKKPLRWSSGPLPRERKLTCGLSAVAYPYQLTVENVYKYEHNDWVTIECQNGYGWSISKKQLPQLIKKQNNEKTNLPTTCSSKPRSGGGKAIRVSGRGQLVQTGTRYSGNPTKGYIKPTRIGKSLFSKGFELRANPE